MDVAAGTEPHHADSSLAGKLRRRLVGLQHRRSCRQRPCGPMISFSFDDAPLSAFTAGVEVLEQRGVRGTFFVCAGTEGDTGFVGLLGTRADMLRVQNAGHEIACHTFSHLDCGRVDAATVTADLARNLEVLQSWGLAPPTTFAYPYGEVGAEAKAALRERFALSRALHRGVIGRGTDLAQAPAIGIEGADGEGKALRWMDRARRRNAWLILFTHGVETEVTRYGCTVAAFGRLVDEALRQGFEVVTVAEGARRLNSGADRA